MVAYRIGQMVGGRAGSVGAVACIVVAAAALPACSSDQSSGQAPIEAASTITSNPTNMTLGPESDTGAFMAPDAVGVWCGKTNDVGSFAGDWTFWPNGYFTVRRDLALLLEGVAYVSASGTEMHWRALQGGVLVSMPDMAIELRKGGLSNAGVDIGDGNGDILLLDGYGYVNCTP